MKISRLNSPNADERRILNNQLEKINHEIAEKEAEDNYKVVFENVKHLENDTENLNAIQMWKLKMKVCPKKSDLPTAKINDCGDIISEPFALRELYENS